MPRFAPALVFATALLACSAQAQELLHTLSEPDPALSYQFGAAVAGVPDTDGDGIDDLLVGAPDGSDDLGRAYLYSGATGAILFALTSSDVGGTSVFGSAVTGVEDVDDDGRGDFLVGDDGAQRAYLFSGASGAFLRTFTSPMPGAGNFGVSVSEVEDANGDGYSDLLIGANNEAAYEGRAYLFSGASGTLLHTFVSPHARKYGYFGQSVSGVPDADGDGWGDVLIGGSDGPPPSPNDAGRAYLFSGATGALLYELVSPNEEFQGRFGCDVAGVPDSDGDSRGDLLIGARDEDPGTSPFDAGRAYVFSGASGALLYELTSQSESEGGHFGGAVAGVPDMDSDGRGDLLVGAWFFGPYGEDPARAYLFSGADGAFRLALTLSGPGGPAEDPPSLAGLNDVSGDGRGDLLVGVPLDDRAYVFGSDLPALVVSPLLHEFGLVYVGTTSAPRVVAVGNAADSPLTITALTLGGAEPDQFEIISAPPLPLVLQPGEEVMVEVAFAPTREELAEAILMVESNGGNAAVVLRGTGRQDLVVTTVADTEDGLCDAHCSLREAIAEASTTSYVDRITFASALAGQTITLTRGELRITQGLWIEGPESGITISGNGESRVFSIDSDDGVELIGLTITGGSADFGGGIRVIFGDLTLDRCTVRDNEAGNGGGISTSARSLTLRNSTISGNHATGNGGGLSVAFVDVRIANSTISGNRAGNGGGGILMGNKGDGYFYLTNSTITSNSAGVRGGGLYVDYFTDARIGTNTLIAGNDVGGNLTHPSADCSRGTGSTISSQGYSVFGEGTGCPAVGTVPPDEVFTRVLSPLLAPNGGPTRTHALVHRDDNPALDLGGTCGPTDQRGFPAPVDGPDADANAECDAGAVEQGATVAVLAMAPVNPPIVIPASGGSFTFTVAATNLTNEPQTLDAWIEATRPDGVVHVAPQGVLLGPVTVMLGLGETVERTLVQTVPASAMAGEWLYAGYAGSHPDVGVASSSFTGVKEAAVPRQEAASGRRESALGGGVWSVAYAESGAPVQAGDVWAAGEVSAVSASAGLDLPSAYALHTVRPNPFAARTTLGYDLPAPSHVRLVVYDLLGREVAVLVNGEVEAGRHAVVLNARGLASGVYVCRLTAGDFAAIRRVVVVR